MASRTEFLTVPGKALAGRAEAAWVFDIARGDPALERLFAERALALLGQSPEMWRDMPYSYDVNGARETCTDPGAAQMLGALRDRLNELSEQEDACQRQQQHPG